MDKNRKYTLSSDPRKAQRTLFEFNQGYLKVKNKHKYHINGIMMMHHKCIQLVILENNPPLLVETLKPKHTNFPILSL